jgi:hypothetical protein
MLIIDDPAQAGDKKLSSAEALARSYEDTDRRLDKYRLADQTELANAEKRLGHPMTSGELIRRVMTLNPDIWAEDSNANPRTVAGFYTVRTDETGHPCKMFLCAFEKGWLPEFSIVIEDRAGLPVREQRGWRTVLVRLLDAHVLTYPQVASVFGHADGDNARNWQSLTQRYR